MRHIIFSKFLKFYVDFKTTQNFVAFIKIFTFELVSGNCPYSDQNTSSGVKVLSKNPNISRLTKRNLFQLNFFSE